MTNLKNGAPASALPACLDKRKAAPLQSSLGTQAGNSNKTKRKLSSRQRAALRVLLDASVPVTVKHLVAETNANNAPELIASLRRRGLKIPCQIIALVNAEGTVRKYGVYRLAKCDKQHALELLDSAPLSQKVTPC